MRSLQEDRAWAAATTLRHTADTCEQNPAADPIAVMRFAADQLWPETDETKESGDE